LKQNTYLFLFILLVFVLNLRLDIMLVDAAQYANISLEMLRTNSYLEVYDQGNDYLDKPPMLFWLSAFSMKIFGVSSWAYKLPSLLILILGIYSLYKLAKNWYNEETSQLAALLLCFNNAWLLMTNDVRTDGILSGFILFSIWQLIEFSKTKKWFYFMGATIGIAAAMMSKGPIGLVIVGMAVGFHWIVMKDWKAIFNWKWILMLVIVGILLAPMLYGLYLQFDLHPEKEVYNLNGPSGILFFFYTQSFGRITGDIYWNNHTTWHFFFDTMAWDMQPWFHLFLIAFIFRIASIVKSRFRFEPNTEYVSLFGFILPLLALSASRFKLPHYIYPIFPFAALITADFLCNKLPSYHTLFKGIKVFQFVLNMILLTIMGVGFFIIFTPSIISVFVFVLGLFGYIFLYLQSNLLNLKWYHSHFFAFGIFGLLMSIYFYPNLLSYQFSSQMGKDLASKQYVGKSIYRYGINDRSFSFYTQNRIPEIMPTEIKNLPSGAILAATAESLQGMDTLIQAEFDTLVTYNNFPVTQLTTSFIFKKSREEILKKAYLLIKK